MIAVSTHWNAARHAGWAPAVRELAALGHLSVALGGPAVHADATEVRRAVRETRGEVVALFAPPPRRDDAGRAAESLVSPRPELRVAAVRSAVAAARAALDAGTRRVVIACGEMAELDPSRESRLLERAQSEGRSDAVVAELATARAASDAGRDRHVEAICRALFDVARAVPDAELLLETPSRLTGFPRPAEFEVVVSELPGRRIAFWHDAAHAARLAALGAVPAEEWLARLGGRTAGVTVSDWTASAEDLPPGSGTVGWAALRAQLATSMSRVLRLDPSFPAPLLADALREARALSL